MLVKQRVFEIVAKAFKMDVGDLSEDTNLLSDLKAKSVNYFPIMNALSDEYDLDLQYQIFRKQCQTVGDIVRMIEKEI